MTAPCDRTGEPLPLDQLPDFFRREAERASPYSRAAARAWRWAADELERSLAARLDEVLSISAASAESGWSYEALRRRVVGEPALNAGTPGAPAIRRRDLQRLGAPRGQRRPKIQPHIAPAAESTTPESDGAPVPSTRFEKIKRHALRSA